ncbi:MAG: elongation factor P maturation arginine rhamnosyltransferase EarP [Treponema sp.]|nr:elongation factor P maturation arginine rhamnosyltransferase EarP [Treponema sp.]
MEITILCKVVDNYGDIGFVYRLARNITELYPDTELRLVVSDLPSFAAMAPFVKEGLARQSARGWQIFDWNKEDVCTKEFSRRIPDVILQCFQCERPEWLDRILFDPEQKKIVRIVNLEYLTAESWADDFHLLKSGTRSILVKKVNFMPGFTKKTGGLVMDSSFLSSLQNKEAALKTIQDDLMAKAGTGAGTRSAASSGISSVVSANGQKEAEADSVQALRDANTFCVTIFAYKRNFTHVVGALKSFMEERQKENPLFRIHAFVAAGLACSPFEEAWKEEGCPFAITKLPYLSQEAWDALLCSSDFNFVRGEDSFARACLCGKPFVWHAYPQDEELHLVKAGAVLERMESFFEDKELFGFLKEYFLLYNTRFSQDEPCEKEEELLLKLLKSYPALSKACTDFSKNLIENGNLTRHLMEYLGRQEWH